MPGPEHHPLGHSPAPAPAPLPKPLTTGSGCCPSLWITWDQSFAVWVSSPAKEHAGTSSLALIHREQRHSPSSHSDEWLQRWVLGRVPLVPPAHPGFSLGSSSVLPLSPQQPGFASTRNRKDKFEAHTTHSVYINPNLFRMSSSDTLVAALRACLSARLLGRSLPLIAVSLSLLGHNGRPGSEMTLSAGSSEVGS